jgi:hypothetical protein
MAPIFYIALYTFKSTLSPSAIEESTKIMLSLKDRCVYPTTQKSIRRPHGCGAESPSWTSVCGRVHTCAGDGVCEQGGLSLLYARFGAYGVHADEWGLGEGAGDWYLRGLVGEWLMGLPSPCWKRSKWAHAFARLISGSSYCRYSSFTFATDEPRSDEIYPRTSFSIDISLGRVKVWAIISSKQPFEFLVAATHTARVGSRKWFQCEHWKCVRS